MDFSDFSLKPKWRSQFTLKNHCLESGNMRFHSIRYNINKTTETVVSPTVGHCSEHESCLFLKFKSLLFAKWKTVLLDVCLRTESQYQVSSSVPWLLPPSPVPPFLPFFLLEPQWGLFCRLQGALSGSVLCQHPVVLKNRVWGGQWKPRERAGIFWLPVTLFILLFPRCSLGLCNFWSDHLPHTQWSTRMRLCFHLLCRGHMPRLVYEFILPCITTGGSEGQRMDGQR